MAAFRAQTAPVGVVTAAAAPAVVVPIGPGDHVFADVDQRVPPRQRRPRRGDAAQGPVRHGQGGVDGLELVAEGRQLRVGVDNFLCVDSVGEGTRHGSSSWRADSTTGQISRDG